MNGEKLDKIINSIDRLELNLKLSLEEIALIKSELVNNDIKTYDDFEPSPKEDEFDKLINEIDQRINDIRNNIDDKETSSIMDVPKIMEDIDNKIVKLRSERNNYEEDEMVNILEDNIDKLNYEQIGLQNYIDCKRMVERIIGKSKEISKDTEVKKNKMLLSLNEPKSLADKNSNLKVYKEFFNNKLKELKRKKTEYIKNISGISELAIADEDKKYIIDEGANNLLRFLSFLMLDFSYSKEAVNYYNIGRFYRNYEEMKKMLLIDMEKKEEFNSYLVELLAVSYQANVMRYDVKYANNDIVENKRISATFRNNKA